VKRKPAHSIFEIFIFSLRQNCLFLAAFLEKLKTKDMGKYTTTSTAISLIKKIKLTYQNF